MENIKEQLETITYTPIRRRLEREFINLLSLDLIYSESVMVKLDNDKINNCQSFLVSFTTIKECNYFEFIIGINYPFRPPKLNINFKPYLHNFNFESKKFKENLFKYKKIRCFCCNTKLCGDNWSPAYTIRHILEEFNDFKQKCRDICYITIIDVIKRKYLNSNINIIEWLL